MSKRKRKIVKGMKLTRHQPSTRVRLLVSEIDEDGSYMTGSMSKTVYDADVDTVFNVAVNALEECEDVTT